MNTIIILFAMYLNDSGTPETNDVAVFGEKGAWEVVASVLNDSARKPADLKFACREGKLPEKS